MSEFIEVGQPLQFTEPNSPTRVGEIVDNVSDIYNIPSPRLGMQVFVKNEKKSFVVTSLKSKTINGVNVPEAAVEAFEAVGAKAITWNNDTNPSYLNDFIAAGVYDIKGERTRHDDNLPILNTGGGHTFNARLVVLDSSISGSGEDDDKCITQMLTLSNRVAGDGDVYIRTGRGRTLDSFSWEPWGKLQQNIEVGQVTSLNNFIDNGIYSGVYTDGSSFFETFVMVVINNYAIAGVTSSIRSVSQFKYAVDVNGIISYKSRVGKGNTNITWNEWKDINEDNIKKLIKTYLQGKSEESNSIYDPFKFLGDFAQNQINEFNTTLDNLTYNTNVTGFGYGYFRALFGYRNVEIANFLISSGQNTIVQVVKGALQIRDGKLTSTGEKYDTFIRKHSVNGWSEWVAEENKIKGWINTEIAKVIDSAPESFDTLREIANWINEHGTQAADMLQSIQQNADNIKYLGNALAEESTRLENKIAQNDNSIKANAVGFQTMFSTGTKDSVTIKGFNAGKTKEFAFNLPVATTENAGVMSATDKMNIQSLSDSLGDVVESINTVYDRVLEDEKKALQANSLTIETRADKVVISGRSIDTGTVIDKPIPAATTESAGVMSAEDKIEQAKKSELENGDIIVGQAREIHSKNGKTVTDSFLVRTTAGSGSVGNGVATLKSVGGNIVKNIVNMSASSSSPNAQVSYSNGILTFKPVEKGSIYGILSKATIIKDHLYYMSVTMYLPHDDTVAIFPTGGGADSVTVSGGLSHISSIKTGVSYQTSVLRIGNPANPPQSDFCHVFRLNLFNLTEMFGAGKEPSKEECDRLFGTMDSLPQGLSIANPTEFKSAGFNQFNPKNIIEGKGIVDNAITNGINKLAIIPCLPCKVGVGENNGYCIHGEFGEDINVYLTPLNPLTAEGELYMHKLEKDATTNTYVPLIKGYLIVEVPTVDNLCVHLKWSADVDEYHYEPYYESKIELPAIPEMSEYGLAGIQSSGTLVCDEIDFVKGVYRKKIGAVDMGSLNWVYITQLESFQCTTLPTTALFCEKYTHKNILAWAQLEDKTFGSAVSGITMIKDTAYSDKASFISSLQGVMLYYELAEPIEYPLPQVANNYISSDYGVEQFNGSIPCNANNLYYMRSLAGETRNYLDRMYGNTSLNSPTEVADYITNGIAENNKKAEDAVTLALRQLYIAAGAEYNDTNENIVKTAPWGETVQHLPKHYYLNGLGDITEVQMTAIYNAPHNAIYPLAYAGYATDTKIRTLILKGTGGHAVLNNGAIESIFNSCLIETLNFKSIYCVNSSLDSMFKNCKKLTHINGTVFCQNCSVNQIFYGCVNLKTVDVQRLSKDISFSDSAELSKNSVLNMINNAMATSAITITLHHDAYVRLTADQEVLDALTAKNEALTAKGGKISLVCATHSEEVTPNA